MAGFDVAAAIFLVSLISLLRSDPDKMREISKQNDANRALLLAITGLTVWWKRRSLERNAPGPAE